jgi:hypothetical protein
MPRVRIECEGRRQLVIFHGAGRIALITLLAFGAVSAIAGGIGLVGGGIQFPLAWLHGSPFSGYTFPELILGLVVAATNSSLSWASSGIRTGPCSPRALRTAS